MIWISAAAIILTACHKQTQNQAQNHAQNKAAEGVYKFSEIPATQLAFTFEPDIAGPSGDTSGVMTKANNTVLFATVQKEVQKDFKNRKDDALINTVVSPDGQRVLALYESEDLLDTNGQQFRIAVYTSDGKLLREVTTPSLAAVFMPMVEWSPDSKMFLFIGIRKSVSPESTDEVKQLATPTPAISGEVVPVFATEQIYASDSDGLNLRALTKHEGLIYFDLAWAPDSHALAALACREDEWQMRGAENMLPAGRPRLIWFDGLNATETLLDDRLTDLHPAWSSDSTKLALAFDTEVAIYDARSAASVSGAGIPLREDLLIASIEYERRQGINHESQASPTEDSTVNNAPETQPVSFNPIVRFVWKNPGEL
ncbi:MAG: hypothetical protein ACRD63_05260, partial [Pyrinomonadaceae bacterium]